MTPLPLPLMAPLPLNVSLILTFNHVLESLLSGVNEAEGEAFFLWSLMSLPTGDAGMKVRWG